MAGERLQNIVLRKNIGGSSTEDYNQIDPHILACFPRSRFTVDLYHYKEKIRTLSPVYAAGNEVSRSMLERFEQMSANGELFFSRKQIKAYTALVACDLYTALDDPNLTWEEKAQVFIDELRRKQSEFFHHPMPQELDNLINPLSSLCAYLIEDNRRMTTIVNRLHAALTPDNRRINASLMALAVYLEMNKGNLFLETLEAVALGFFLYDIGMSKVSELMIGKRQKLTPSEQRTLQTHPQKGLEIVNRLNMTRPEIVEPIIQHHERLNGSGYPNKLAADKIGQLGRIAGVADSYIAMVTDNAQRAGITPIEAAAEFLRKKNLYDQMAQRTLIRYLQTVPAS
ncbi:HD domain-containing phosphohydrolase [Pseudodesulfovibrio sp. zrk46]|uniref:HD-GYP domain-containing protein n=1 Tax=Pseudodesulfovibrio sp. zrk46 TaxID=2725288 RepID=UPI001449C993|nr:HD domain-containing phosphohydrolase [Pseudodesulfovibrio sp. zrk46]QJB56080.1 metal-dependent phosphohydrolase [Pseudodesulfovibrio sp. zrk46]